ncbi:MAG TPA: T9SS type A sorting domain-containing protein, partial [bacterium]|nr:T9SS type A sorting domain-containing protein [bacterium]
LLFGLLILGMAAPPAHAQVWRWATQASPDTAARPLASARDRHGNLLVAGWFRGTQVFGADTLRASGLPNAFVAKLSAAGQWLWARQVRHPGNRTGPNPPQERGSSSITALAVDTAGNVVFTGTFWGRASVYFGSFHMGNPVSTNFVASLTPAGQWQWATRVTQQTYPTVLVLDETGHAFIAGYQYDTQQSSQYRLALWRVSRTGWYSWRAYQMMVVDWDLTSPVRMAFDRTGNLCLAVAFTGQITGGGWNGQLINETSAGGSDILLLGANRGSGLLEWGIRLGGSANEVPAALVRDPVTNDLWLAGQYDGATRLGADNLACAGASDIFLVRIDSSHQWQDPYRVGGPGADSCRALAIGPAGDHYIAGQFTQQITLGDTTLTSAGGSVPDVFVAQAKDQQWQHAARVGEAGAERVWSLTLSPDSVVTDTGAFTSPSLPFSNTTLHSSPSAAPGSLFVASVNLTAPPPRLGPPLLPAPPDSQEACTLWPDPATTYTNLRLSRAPAAPLTVRLFDATGRLIRQQELPAGQVEVVLSLQGLAPGLYLARVDGRTCRVVVQ